MILLVFEWLQVQILRLAGFRRRWLETPGGRVHSWEIRGGGSLPPLLVLHGINASVHQLAWVLVGLRKRHARIVAIDLPGHGYSDTPPSGLDAHTLGDGMLAALDQLVDEKVVVYGNSMGGLAAIRYVQARPERILGLLLSSPGGAHDDEAGLQAFLGSFRIREWAQARAFCDTIHARPPWYAPLIASGMVRMFQRAEFVQFLERIHAEDLLTPADLAPLPAATRVVWGRDDRLMPQRHRDWYRANVPAHVEWHDPEGIGHCPYLDRPDAVVAHITDFAEAVQKR